MQDRVILTIFDPMKILGKMQKHIFFGIGMRQSDFGKVFDPQGIDGVICPFLPMIVFIELVHPSQWTNAIPFGMTSPTK